MDIRVISYGNMKIPFRQNIKMQKTAQDKEDQDIKSKRTNRTQIRRRKTI